MDDTIPAPPLAVALSTAPADNIVFPCDTSAYSRPSRPRSSRSRPDLPHAEQEARRRRRLFRSPCGGTGARSGPRLLVVLAASALVLPGFLALRTLVRRTFPEFVLDP